MTTTRPAPYQLTPEHRRVFIGLMLGMFVASISQTIVGPAMPRIVAELGGIEHYSWVATAAMLVSAVVVPIVGKLSDLYGRRVFYMAGLAVFLAGSVISGLAPNFWVLVAGRAVQGLGMGTLMPLSQTIIGDIIPPRQRGKYQGLMGAVFGVTSVAGPLAGGVITDLLGWRWLFFAALPVGVVAWVVIFRFLHLEQPEQRKARIDVPGIIALSVGITAVLLATSWGGTTYPWLSTPVLGLYAVGLVTLVGFVLIELRAEEPVLPLRLFGNGVFSWSVLAAFIVSMLMFGALIYIPVFAQGVVGVDATGSGLILVPMMLGLIVMGIVAGLFITRTGRYKELMLLGVVLMGVGYWMLTRLGADSTATALAVAMTVLGVGLGMAQQQYTLVVQNAVSRRDLGVATATTQFARNVGSTIGIALFGSVMTAGMSASIARNVPPEARDQLAEVGELDAASVLDPEALAQVPPALAGAVRSGLAEQLHQVFLLGLPLVVVAFLATLMIRVIPLRDTVHTQEDAQRELLDTMSSTSPSEQLVPVLRRGEVGARTRERLLGLQLLLLAEAATLPEHEHLRRSLTDLGEGDLERGRMLLLRTAEMLRSDDNVTAAAAERFACAVAERAGREGGLLPADVRRDLAVAASELDREQVLSLVEPTVAERHAAVDVSRLFQAASELNAAFLVDASTTQGGPARRP